MAIQVPLTTDGSWRVLQELIAGRTKLIAARLQRNAGLIQNWQTPPPSDDNPNSDGDPNPLDWIVRVLRALGDDQAREGLDWLCRQFGCRAVPAAGGSGDGKLFRTDIDAIPHLKSLMAEIRKPSPSPQVLRQHLDEAFAILSAHVAQQEVHDDHAS